MDARLVARANLSVVVTTYEWPAALDAVLRALADQSDRDFDVVVADDGSGSETREAAARWRDRFGDRLTHVWQPDRGRRAAEVRNRGALEASGDVLVFLDGDCIPRRHAVRALREAMRPGWFTAGRRVGLSKSLSERVLTGSTTLGRRSLPGWAVSRMRREVDSVAELTLRDRRRVGHEDLPEFEPRERAFGFLLGAARADFERVNGFDNRYVGWGEEDVDLAVRLRRLGLRCGHAGPNATVLHLWHEVDPARERPNWDFLLETERSDRIEAVQGLREPELPPGWRSGEREPSRLVELVEFT